MSMSSIDLSVRSNRFIMFRKPDKYKGSAVLHVVNNLRSVASKGVCLSGAFLGSVLPHSQGLTVTFRGCVLCGRVGICSGVTLKLGLHSLPHAIVGAHMGATTTFLKVSSVLAGGVHSVSSSRHRHITLKHTVIYRPGILLMSRSFTRRSSSLQGSVVRSVLGVGGRLKVAILCIAGGCRRTISLGSHIVFVGSKGMVRSDVWTILSFFALTALGACFL